MLKKLCISILLIACFTLRSQSYFNLGYTHGDFYQVSLGYEISISKNRWGGDIIFNFSDEAEPPSQRAWEKNWHPFTFGQRFGVGLKYGRELYEYKGTKLIGYINSRVSHLGIKNVAFAPSLLQNGETYYMLDKYVITEPFWSIKNQLQIIGEFPLSDNLIFRTGLGMGTTSVYNHMKGEVIFFVNSNEPSWFTQLSYSFLGELSYNF